MVRDPPRKSAEAIFRAVCSRGQRAQCKRREPTACTERRCRNGRRWRYRFRVLCTQRQWLSRLLAVSSPGDRMWTTISYSDLRTYLHQYDYRNTVGLQKYEEEMEMRQQLICSDCEGGISVADSWRTKYGLKSEIWKDVYFAVSCIGNKRLDVMTGMDTPGFRCLLILLSWITGLDSGFAHASYLTLIVPLILSHT